ncbi:MAG: M20/M25/M40 family metallo-hydrolase [Variovorax sp.]
MPSPQFDAAWADIDADVETAVSDLARLIACDTSFPPGRGYDPFADLMDAVMRPLGFATERVRVPEALWQVPGGPAAGPRTNLIATRRSGKPTCGLYFHVDTVPPAAGWQGDPLRLQRDGECLTGLGAADMKGTIAAVLLALRAAERHGVELAYDPMLLLCTDEEGGLYPGVRYLAEQGRLEGHIVNFNGSAEARVWAGCFGLFNLLIRVRGQTVHAGEGNRIGSGRSAIEGALPLLQRLYDLKAEVAKRTSKLPPPPHASGPLAAQLSIAALHGGTCGGQIPALLEITVCRRYAPEEDFEAIRAQIESLVRECVAREPGLSVDIDLIGHLIPVSDPYGAHWPRWQRAVGAGFGYAPEDFKRWGAASCSDFGYVQQFGMQEVLLGGLGRPNRNVHSPGEHTTTTDMVALARSVLAYLAADFEPTLNPESSQYQPA